MRLEGACFKTRSCRVCSQHSVELKPLLINFGQAGTDPRCMIVRAKDWEMCVYVRVCVCAKCRCVKQWVQGTKTQTLMIPCRPQINCDNSRQIDRYWRAIRKICLKASLMFACPHIWNNYFSYWWWGAPATVSCTGNHTWWKHQFPHPNFS